MVSSVRPSVRFAPRKPLQLGPWAGRRTSELRRHGKERELVVGLAQASRQDAHRAPEHVVRKIVTQKQELLETIAAHGEKAAALVHHRVGRARGIVEQGHLAEDIARAYDRERLLA